MASILRVMNPRFCLGSLVFIGGMYGCASPEIAIPARTLLIPEAAKEGLAYPTFLQDPQTASTYRLAGLEARQQGNFEQAIATLKTAVALAPQNVSGYVLLGWTQHLAQQRPAAIVTLTQALQQDAEYVPALNALGIVYLVEGDLENAIATHTQAKTLQADNEIAYYNLSLAYQRVPDIPAAIDHAVRATELEPYNPHPWVALALAHWSQEDYAAAQSTYQDALQLDGRYGNAYHLDHLLQAGFSAEQIQLVDEIRLSIQ